MKESKALTFGAVGFSVAALFGVVIISETPDEQNVVHEVFIAAAGAIIGVLYGASLGRDITYQIEGQSDTEIKEVLEELRRQARVPDAQ